MVTSAGTTPRISTKEVVMSLPVSMAQIPVGPIITSTGQPQIAMAPYPTRTGDAG
jgi:hypothetical protein